MRPRPAGFTLIEVAVAVAIVALVAGIAVPALTNLSRAHLRKSASELAGHIRSSYDSAALQGQTYRLVFDLGKSVIREQASGELLRFEGGSGALVAAAKDLQLEGGQQGLGDGLEQLDPLLALRPGGAAPRKAASEMQPARSEAAVSDAGATSAGGAAPGSAGGGALSALMHLGDLAQSGAAKGADGFDDVGQWSLSEGVQLLDIWTEDFSTPVVQGEVYLVFFPHGYTQDAIVHLQDGEGRVFAVTVDGLTGQTGVQDHYVRAEGVQH